MLDQIPGVPEFPQLKAKDIQVLQVNVGKLCNQICKHCHVDAGPTRREIMTRETMQLCLAALARTTIPIVDITGGAPEMNPEFKWFVAQARALGRHVMVRSNLTILVARGFEDYAEFMAEHGVEIVSSLPHYSAATTNRQRGDGVFERSIDAIRRLNSLGYGLEGSSLKFNLVYNPAGAFLPPRQEQLEADYKRELGARFGISFHNLYTITNMPISRYLDYLVRSGNLETYLLKLVALYNPVAAENVMCKTTVSVGWDGYLYDCDFNQMLELKLAAAAPQHIRDFDFEPLSQRDIVTRKHCYGCTAGSGSSCGGTVA